MTEQYPVIDIPEALDRSMGDVQFLQAMLDEFQRMIPDFVGRIENALNNEDLEALGRDAHQFKGTAANLGAKRIAAVALALEQMGKNGDAQGGPQAFAHLRSAVDDFIHHLAFLDWTSIGQD